MSNSVRKAECREPKTTFFFSSQTLFLMKSVMGAWNFTWKKEAMRCG
jgi:hypothetical protein